MEMTNYMKNQSYFRTKLGTGSLQRCNESTYAGTRDA